MTYNNFNRLFIVETKDHQEIGRVFAYLYRDAFDFDKAKQKGFRILTIGGPDAIQN